MRKYNSIDEVINLFDDGMNRYQTEQVFRKVVDAIYMGEDPINLLDQTTKIIKNQTESIKDIIERATFPIIVKKDKLG
ncbi:hypothetical protein [Winogradskyella luteola]|uniref:Uncharacterized protein n=1 Tax=Winogradskyella luteola TaxID=2828330 RepID=A0A9X1JR97_9FLAO|nr:hypothetical protein [Winogradskyella luteola]MBV7268387.1 hypothetical protein [Winogradskyella luteola]